jgi:transposase
MGWPERSVVSLRKEFVFKVLGKEASIAELSRQYGISRKTAYKWLRRFKKHGIAGLLDESKKPKRSPTQTAEAMHVEIVRLRREHPTWGAKKLRVLLLRNFGEQAPCPKTIERVLAKNGLVRRRKWRTRAIARPTHLTTLPSSRQRGHGK